MDHDTTALLSLKTELADVTATHRQMIKTYDDLENLIQRVTVKMRTLSEQIIRSDQTVSGVLVQIERVIAGNGLDPRTIDGVLGFVRENPGIAKSELGYRYRKYANLNIEDKDKLILELVDAGLIEIKNVLKTKKSKNPALHLYPTQYSKTEIKKFDY